jgi:hypothetical protein
MAGDIWYIFFLLRELIRVDNDLHGTRLVWMGDSSIKLGEEAE